MHEDYPTPCPTCDGEDDDCWHCRGSGLMDPDGMVARMEESAKSLTDKLCPKCRKSARRRDDGAIYCTRCGTFTTPFDDADVLNDPRILEP